MLELIEYQLHKMGVKSLCPRIQFSRLYAKGQKQLRLLDFWLAVFGTKRHKESSKNVPKIYKNAKISAIG